MIDSVHNYLHREYGDEDETRNENKTMRCKCSSQFASILLSFSCVRMCLCALFVFCANCEKRKNTKFSFKILQRNSAMQTIKVEFDSSVDCMPNKSNNEIIDSTHTHSPNRQKGQINDKCQKKVQFHGWRVTKETHQNTSKWEEKISSVIDWIV